MTNLPLSCYIVIFADEKLHDTPPQMKTEMNEPVKVHSKVQFCSQLCSDCFSLLPMYLVQQSHNYSPKLTRHRAVALLLRVLMFLFCVLYARLTCAGNPQHLRRCTL